MLFTLSISLFLSASSHPALLALHPDEVSQAKAWVEAMKANPRGPYIGVMWFCEDGEMLPPKPYACKEHGGGKQYAVASKQALQLQAWGLPVGTILAASSTEQFKEHDHYRAKAYIVERFLERLLDGWVLKKGKTYRGFRQIEDEQAAAEEILAELFRNPQLVQNQRAFAIRLLRAMPYGGENALADNIRGLAAQLGDTSEAFEELRFKIHAMLEPDDAKAVLSYASVQENKEHRQAAKELAAMIKRYYSAESQRERLKKLRPRIWKREIKDAIDDYLQADPKDVWTQIDDGIRLLHLAHHSMQRSGSEKSGQRNLLLINLMSIIEQNWLSLVAPLAKQEMSRRDALILSDTFVRGAYYLGMLSAQEQEQAHRWLDAIELGYSPVALRHWNDLSRLSQWARARYLTSFHLAIERYAKVEPHARRLIDDLLRSGIMLPLAKVIDRLAKDFQSLNEGGHRVEGLGAKTNAMLISAVRGENSGLANGALKRATNESERKQLSRKDIALLYDLPPDLPPVAGIITVGATGGLSHVALLARNLGIPHISISEAAARELERWSSHHRQNLLLGVSAQRQVLLGPITAFKNMVDPKRLKRRQQVQRAKAFLKIDEERLDLTQKNILMLKDLAPQDSGRIVGPKAAELARLFQLFPKRVSNAAAIPFGAFVAHVSRAGLNGEPSPLKTLQNAYISAKQLPPDLAENYLLQEMATFRAQIEELPFVEGFREQVEEALKNLGPIKKTGVFVRSDTNVEDLKEFTGAGLNKTVPHRVGLVSVLRAIRKVWASPYAERSFKWRQKLLVNPHYVFPSVLLHKTVPSEKSGVLVTTDLTGQRTSALTISVSEGVAAVVDGGSPETIVVDENKEIHWISSGRSATRKQIPLPPQEGVTVAPAAGLDPVLNNAEREKVIALAEEIQTKVPNPERLVWDVEFGIYDKKVWLFQIRPLRTSKLGSQHPALIALDKGKQGHTWLDMSAPLQ